eukprot:1603609-Amphidinium_carterae.2
MAHKNGRTVVTCVTKHNFRVPCWPVCCACFLDSSGSLSQRSAAVPGQRSCSCKYGLRGVHSSAVLASHYDSLIILESSPTLLEQSAVPRTLLFQSNTLYGCAGWVWSGVVNASSIISF